MPEYPASPPQDLPDALAQALGRAAGTSLLSLHHLRDCVINYSRRQEARGIPLNDVIVAIGRLLMTAEDDATPDSGTSGARDPELARQIRAWCAEGYARNDRAS